MARTSVPSVIAVRRSSRRSPRYFYTWNPPTVPFYIKYSSIDPDISCSENANIENPYKFIIDDISARSYPVR